MLAQNQFPFLDVWNIWNQPLVYQKRQSSINQDIASVTYGEQQEILGIVTYDNNDPFVITNNYKSVDYKVFYVLLEGINLKDLIIYNEISFSIVKIVEQQPMNQNNIYKCFGVRGAIR
jgi:hypothetical protein